MKSFVLRSQNRSYEIKNTWTCDESKNVDETRHWRQMGVGNIDLMVTLKMEIILILLNWILPFLIDVPQQAHTELFWRWNPPWKFLSVTHGLNIDCLLGNPHIPNIDAISGALFTLRIQYEFTQTQCDDGARDGIDIGYMGIIRTKTLDFFIKLDLMRIILEPVKKCSFFAV